MSPVKMNLIFGGIVLSSAGAFGGGLMYPGLRELQARQAEISAELDKSKQVQAAVGDMGHLYNDVMRMKTESEILWDKVPNEARIGDFLNELSRCLKFCGITECDIQPQPAREVDADRLPEELKLAANISVLDVKLRFNSTFERLFRLLERIENLERLVHIETLRVMNDEKSPGDISIELDLQAYYRRPS